MRHYKFKKDFTTSKSGTVIKEGSVAFVTFLGDGLVARVQSEEATVKVYSCNLHKALTGFEPMPDDDQLERWSFDGMCETVTGHTVEPDGRGPDGSPSWLLALGLC